MRLLAFDARMGASGDMILGALIDAGADPAVLEPVSDQLPVEYHVTRTERCGIDSAAVQVRSTKESTDTDHDHSQTELSHSQDGDAHAHTHEEETREHSHEEGTHEHGQDYSSNQGDEDHQQAEGHSHQQAEGHGPHRTYAAVIEILEAMELPSHITTQAEAIFRLLGEAEARVHGTALEETHFHEVGADDAIADIVGAVLLVDDLDPDRVVTTPVSAGGGTVEMSHGIYPVPVPAVTELAAEASWQLQGGPLETELLTPTGGAILAHLADGVERLPAMTVEATGYGAGSKSFDAHPNVLRALRGQGRGELHRDPVTVLETNLDDATPEELGGLQDSLSAVGALDVSILPATMKKSRPGHLVKVIVKPEDVDRVARRLAVETGTLGVREHGRGHRLIADRERRTVTLELGDETFDISVKIARIDSTVFDVSAEFDDASAVGRQTGEPVKELMRRAETKAHEQLEELGAENPE